MSAGVKRLPVSPFEQFDAESSNSAVSLSELIDYKQWIEDYLQLGTRKAFKITQGALDARRRQQYGAKEASFVVSRDVQQLGMLVVATVKEMEQEFVRRTVLDIGCGTGRFGQAIARQAKAKVTFVDTDESALARIGPRAGTKVVADGRALPFNDESFDRTVVAFSTLTWANTLLESAQGFSEAVRVSSAEGSIFFIPAFSNILKRAKYISRAERTNAFKRLSSEIEDPRALKVWALQDYVVLHSLFSLIENNRASVTWQGYVAEGVKGTTMDHWSAIVDMEDSVPKKELEEPITLAKSFMPK